MTKNFASVSEALLADVKAMRLSVTIGGRTIRCFEAHTSHGVKQPIATCSLVIAAPLPSVVTLNTDLRVQAGYPGAARTIFVGRIPAHSAAINEQGKFATVTAVGYAALLDYPDAADLGFWGSISLKRIFQALCKRRKVPAYRSEEVLSTLGGVIQLGGVSEIDGGTVIIPRDTSPLQWLTQKAELFGYAVFDTPVRVVQQRVSGMPTATSEASYEEGVNAYSFSRSTDTGPMVTYWEVKGARYTSNVDGRTVAIRSIPDVVPYAAELDPPGYRKDTKQDASLVTTALARAVRNVLEINQGAPSETTTWEVDGAPDRAPGDVVTVDSATCQCSGDRWLMRLDQSVIDTQGYYATMEGWTGTGTSLPAGHDCTSIAVGSGSYHVGDETLSYFADPTPDGTLLTPVDPVKAVIIAFTAPDEYSSLTFEAVAHSCNTHLSEEDDQDSTWSTWEIWQAPDPTIAPTGDNAPTRRGSGDLPLLGDASAAPDYAGDDSLWSAIVIPVTGSLVAGDAELRLLSGHNPLPDPDGTYDDYEVKDIVLRVCGVNQPDLPREGAT